jgi:hypothetical protein
MGNPWVSNLNDGKGGDSPKTPHLGGRGTGADAIKD